MKKFNDSEAPMSITEFAIDKKIDILNLRFEVLEMLGEEYGIYREQWFPYEELAKKLAIDIDNTCFMDAPCGKLTSNKIFNIDEYKVYCSVKTNTEREYTYMGTDLPPFCLVKVYVNDLRIESVEKCNVLVDDEGLLQKLEEETYQIIKDKHIYS